MKRSVIVAAVLLALIAVLHFVRIVFGISLKIADDEVSYVFSIAAILTFGLAAVYLWRDA